MSERSFPPPPPGILSERSESKDPTKHQQLYNVIEKPKGSLDYARDARRVVVLGMPGRLKRTGMVFGMPSMVKAFRMLGRVC